MRPADRQDREYQGYVNLAIAMLHEAVIDVQAGKQEAIAYVHSDDFALWAEILGLNPRWLSHKVADQAGRLQRRKRKYRQIAGRRRCAKTEPVLAA